MKTISILSLLSFLLLCSMLTMAQNSSVLNFERFPLTDTTFYNGSDNAGGFTVNGAFFENSYTSTPFESWSGFAVSKTTDTATKGFPNQYTSSTGSGFAGTKQYVIGYLNNRKTIRLDTTRFPQGTDFFWVNNTNWSYWSMKDGDQFTIKFGGNDGNTPDSLILKGYGYHNGNIIDSASLALADYRFSDNTQDYIQREWLSFKLNGIDSLELWLESSNSGVPMYIALDYMVMKGVVNTPAFDLSTNQFYNGTLEDDGFTSSELGMWFRNRFSTSSFGDFFSGFATSTVFDSTTGGSSNQYSPMANITSITTTVPNSQLIPLMDEALIGYNPAEFITVSEQGGFTNNWFGNTGEHFLVNNTAYAYYSMKNGDQFGKKFGDTTGGSDGKDYFILDVFFWDKNGNIIDTLSHTLADFRDADTTKHFIQSTWQEFSSTSLIPSAYARVSFGFQSSDTGQFGINTPLYLALLPVGQTTGFTAQSIQEKQWTASIQQDELQVRWNDYPTTEIRYHLFDMNGSLVKTMQSSSDLASWSVSGLANGMYILQANIDVTAPETQKIIKW